MTFINNLKLLPIYLINTIGGINLKTHLLMPLLGYLFLLRERKVPKLFLFAISAYALAVIPLIQHFSLSSTKNLLLTGSLPLFSLYLIKYYSTDQLLKLGKACLALIYVFFIFEAILLPVMWKYFFYRGLFYLPQFNGPTGFPNHTAVAGVSLSLIFLVKKRFFWFGLGSIIPFLTGSQTALVVFLIGFVLFLVSLIKPAVSNLLIRIVLILTTLSPLLIVGVEKTLSSPTKDKINRISSFRFVLQTTFLEVFKDNPLGVGVDRSHLYHKPYAKQGSSIIKDGFFSYEKNMRDQQVLGPHSSFFKILVENGIFGYLSFSVFLIGLAWKKEPRHTIVLAALLSGGLMMNLIWDFIFYFVIALIISDKRDDSRLTS